MPNKLSKNHKVVFASILILIGILGRTIFHIGDNIEFVTVGTLLAGSYLGGFWAFFVPLTIMAVSDLFLGNTLIFIFTWSAYLFMALFALAQLRSKNSLVGKLFKAELVGFFSSIFFFLWTNFGVWALDSFGMYSNDLSGLIASYIMGIPFLKSNILSNLLFIPLFFVSVELVFSENSKKAIFRRILPAKKIE